MKQGKATVARRPRYSKRFVTAVFDACDAARITGEAVALEAGVNPTHVYNVRALRRTSAPVVDAGLRVLARTIGGDTTVETIAAEIRDRLAKPKAA